MSVYDVVAVVVGAISFAVIFRTPRRHFLITFFVACLSGFSVQQLPFTGLVVFGISAGLGLLSNLAARVLHTPTQAFLIPSVIFLVPGTYIYRGLSSFLAQEMNDASQHFGTAIQVSFAITFGILLANWLLPSKQDL